MRRLRRQDPPRRPLARDQVPDVHRPGAPAAVDEDRGDQIEAQEREIGQVVLRQRLAAEVGMHQPQPTKSTARGAQATHVGEHQLGGITDDHVLDRPAPVDQDPDLPADML